MQMMSWVGPSLVQPMLICLENWLHFPRNAHHFILLQNTRGNAFGLYIFFLRFNFYIFYL